MKSAETRRQDAHRNVCEKKREARCVDRYCWIVDRGNLLTHYCLELFFDGLKRVFFMRTCSVALMVQGLLRVDIGK